jgi:hypothetical protein
MYSSRMGYLSPSLSPSGATSATLPATSLCGLGLSNCHLLPGTNEALPKPSPSVASPTGRSWLSNEVGQDLICASTEQSFSASNCTAINTASATTNSMSPDLVQGVAAAATIHPTNGSCFEYPCSSGLNTFGPCPYRTASSLEFQTPSYVTTSSTMVDFRYPWCELEQQDDYQIPKVSTSYSIPLRLESPAMSHAIFAGSAPESPTSSTNLQSGARAENYLGFDMGADMRRSQHRPKGHRASSWPGDCPYLEQGQEMDACVTTKRDKINHTTSRHSYRSHSKTGRVSRDRGHGTTRASVRVTCTYGNECRQTFNRKTDLDRHINTVRHTINHIQTFTDIFRST